MVCFYENIGKIAELFHYRLGQTFRAPERGGSENFKTIDI
jgi:hypothetical protein